jgi:hypothetical protein
MSKQSSSTLDALLDKGDDLALSELLDEGELLTEVKWGNQKLLAL